MKELLKILIYSLARFLNRLTRKDKKTIMFVPHHNCLNDGYDIINYKSDNVLCLLNSVLQDDRYSGYTFNIVYYHREKLSYYQNNCERYNHNLRFVYFDNFIRFYRAFCQSSLIFTDEYVSRYPYKCKNQKSVCLNYFPAPFKEGLYASQFNSVASITKMAKSINGSYDMLVSVSDLSSKLIAISCQFNYAHCVTLGFPRNDVFYADNNQLMSKVIETLGINASKIFLYVPTHRDYENPKRKQFDGTQSNSLIMGLQNSAELEKINHFLEVNDAIIIAKLHPIQCDYLKSISLCSRIVSYHEISSRITLSLNELMTVSDCLITDYSSAVFDYFNTNRPVIYHVYDYEKYVLSRGFTINPIEPLCAGIFSHNTCELINAMKSVIDGKDAYKDKRQFIADLLFTHKDNQSALRIKDYFMPL